MGDQRAFLVMACALVVGCAAEHDGPTVPKKPHRLANVVRALADAPETESSSLLARDPLGRRMLERDERGRVLVQIAAAPGHGLEEITDALLRRFGATVRARGTNVLDAWVPVGRLVALGSTIPAIGHIQPPRRPEPSLGSRETQGTALTAADHLHCAGTTGAGVHIALVDLEFGSFAKAQSEGELGTVVGTVSTAGGAHGTACAEIIFDMAPGITLHPVLISTLAELESFAKTLPGSEIDIVSTSLNWFGDSFDDGTGPHCEMTTQAKQAGIVWVNSFGNSGSDTMYRGSFTDADDNDRHEFATGDEYNEFTLTGTNNIGIQLDWDAYPTTNLDLDLELYRRQGSEWNLVASSTETQNGSQPPVEELYVNNASSGTYGIVVVRKSGDLDGVRLRVYLPPEPLAPAVLQHAQAEGSLRDPGSCADVIAVGAVPHGSYDEGTIWPASSRGPTSDGRNKPDLVAPSGVRTMVFGAFHGTSAAAPHVAGALALYVEGMSTDPWSAATQLLADAEAVSGDDAANTHGNGRLRLQASRGGWECVPGSSGPCPTECGSTGEGTCDDTCQWKTCDPPAELCNGEDDDCDSAVDNGFDCAVGASADCLTACGSTGTHTCGDTCSWGSCVAPAEQCNDQDDDCDGVVDEDCSGEDDGGCMLSDRHHGSEGTPVALMLLLIWGACSLRRRRG